MPDERHALDELLVGAHHAVEPPAVVLAPHVDGVERIALGVAGRRAREPGRPLRAGQAEHSGVEAARGQRPRLPGARAETGPPQQAGGVGLREAAAEDGQRHLVAKRARAASAAAM